jgi:hypothetical protein
MARDTVIFETPSARAMSANVVGITCSELSSLMSDKL